MNQYSFQYAIRDDVGQDFPVAKTSSVNLEFHDSVLWTTVLDEFINFLSSVYGYNIRDQVEYLSYQEKLQKLKAEGKLELDEEEEEDWRKIL